jgi:proline dehydrogenase
VGCTLPARWSRSLIDVERAADLGLRVRVVKGQWADPAEPDIDIGAAYLKLIDRLAGRVRTVAVATHDPALARAALARLRESGTPSELELLFGLPMKGALAVAREEGVPVCIYVPFGNGWMPYAFSQLRRNPGIALWMFRDAMAVASLRPRG